MGGLMSIAGRPDVEAGGGPLKAGVALTGILPGLYATVGILAALAHRDRTGEGQRIDAALLDVQVACLANQATDCLASGQQPLMLGNGHPDIVPYQDFRTADGRVIVAVGNDGQFARLCEALGHPGWSADPRFATDSARLAHRDVLIPLVQDVLSTCRTAAWLAVLSGHGVPCGPINDLEEVFADPQLVHRGLRIELPDGDAGGVPALASPLRLSGTPVRYRSPPPALGAHTRDVLRRLLDLPPERIDAPLDDKVVGG